MNWLQEHNKFIIFCLVMLAYFGYRWVSKANPAHSIDAKTLANNLQNPDFFLLDVREKSEWNDGHIKQATLVPLGSLSKNIDKIPKDKEIIIICRSGHRAGLAGKILKGQGYEKYKILKGGMLAWQQISS